MKNLLVALTFATTIAGNTAVAQVQTVAAVDLESYMGTWYEQARLPMYFQRKCDRNTTANYSLRPDGHVDVLNSCEADDGRKIVAQGVARKVGNSTSRLEVRFAPAFLSFLPFVWGDYWIIGLDEGYRWSVVGSPDRKYLWILSREKQLPDETYRQLVDLAKAQGFDTSRLVRTRQL
ncbi:lipocalin family protein [Luteimonas sp. 50]|uniref:Outer membrane lipoprotein Blc n=1 Tax=Cognatiluteimonas sedimenti TaxID=2927791 RepID=A0ABT0A1A0_9GAMM|nr:lipocalin family protein [Lysobacter sedimenti]MCJ0824723.1 lipocalin family protein [Lysobacter sedimenti]